MINEGSRLFADLEKRLRSLTNKGGEIGSDPKIVTPWEDNKGEVLKDLAKQKRLSFSYVKGVDESGNNTFTYTLDDTSITLTRHLDNFNVGENNTPSCYFSTSKEEWEKAVFFQEMVKRDTVEIHTIKTTESGDVVEKVASPR